MQKGRRRREAHRSHGAARRSCYVSAATSVCQAGRQWAEAAHGKVCACKKSVSDVFGFLGAERRSAKNSAQVAIDRCGWVFAAAYGPKAHARDLRRKKSVNRVFDFLDPEQRTAKNVAQVRDRPMELDFVRGNGPQARIGATGVQRHEHVWVFTRKGLETRKKKRQLTTIRRAICHGARNRWAVGVERR